MDQCIFCDSVLDPGSEEHVFLSALGGRVTTRKATCVTCNNAFAKGDKIDDRLAEALVIPRCALLIWTGRRQPPPTITKAGTLENGPEFDFAPGFVPIARPAAIPKAAIQSPAGFFAKDEADAERVIRVLRARGEPVVVARQRVMEQKPPLTDLPFKMHVPSTLRGVAKSALTAACILYGNESARTASSLDLRRATRFGAPDIAAFVGWDFVNDWPSNIEYTPHKTASSVTEPMTSGVEHFVFFCDVGSDWIAYVALFTGFRFSVRLGPTSGLPPRGFAVNPRSGARLTIKATAPSSYQRRTVQSFTQEHGTILQGCHDAMTAVLSIWREESGDRRIASQAEELATEVSEASDDSTVTTAIRRWAEKMAILQRGERWEQDLDPRNIDDE